MVDLREMTDEELAYTAYSQGVDYENCKGEPLTPWSELSEGMKTVWYSVARAIVSRYTN